MPITEWADDVPARRPPAPRVSQAAPEGARRQARYEYMPRAGVVVIDGRQLRYWRDRRLMSRTELARRVRIDRDAIGSFERGTRYPRLAAFRRLFTALGCGPEDLLAEGTRYGMPGYHGLAFDNGAGVNLDDEQD